MTQHESTQIRIGISGWRYAGWRGDFYPKGLPQRRELEFAAGRVSSIELNGSFYSLQRPSSYTAWYEATPPGFVFSHKGNRYLTHILRLGEGIDKALANVKQEQEQLEAQASDLLAYGDYILNQINAARELGRGRL